jgi:hypothetical protein
MEWSICTDKGIYTFIRDEALNVASDEAAVFQLML